MRCDKNKILLWAHFFVLLCFLPLSGIWAQDNRKILVEDLTGSWCGFCPDGAASMAQLEANYPNAICVGVHISDPMQTTTSDAIGDAYSGGGVNVLMLDRQRFEGENFVQLTSAYPALAQRFEERLAMPVEVRVSLDRIALDSTTRQLTADIRAVFVEKPTNYNALRLNLWLTEDSVTRTQSSYNQVNFFNAYTGHPYFNAGNPIQGFVHRHVLRADAGGAWGVEGGLPPIENIEAGQSFVQTYTLELNPEWNVERMHLIGFVQAYNNDEQLRHILNAESIDLFSALQTPQTTDTLNTDTSNVVLSLAPFENIHPALVVYPNPALSGGQLKVAFYAPTNLPMQLLLFDIQGKHVALILSEQTYSRGWHTINCILPDLALGKYLLRAVMPTHHRSILVDIERP